VKKIAILVADLYDDNELYYPYYRLLEEGYQVDLIGALSNTTYKSKHGLPVVTTHAAKDVFAKDYDGLVIPGGFSPDYMRRSSDIVAFTKDMDKLQKPMAAICHGAWLMASACDLKNKNMTCFFSIKDDIIHAGANYLDEAVVVDGHLVTSRTPKDLPVFVKTFISVLEK
jgi:protease I